VHDEDGHFGERVAASYDESAAEMFESLESWSWRWMCSRISRAAAVPWSERNWVVRRLGNLAQRSALDTAGRRGGRRRNSPATKPAGRRAVPARSPARRAGWPGPTGYARPSGLVADLRRLCNRRLTERGPGATAGWGSPTPAWTTPCPHPRLLPAHPCRLAEQAEPNPPNPAASVDPARPSCCRRLKAAWRDALRIGTSDSRELEDTAATADIGPSVPRQSGRARRH